MAVQIYGFDWVAYAEHIMPAFKQWFIQRDESAIYRLFKETRCAREEEFLPSPLLNARIWPRARTFVEALPVGPYSRREYHKLCSAEHFTALSDRFIYKHIPQLYQNPEAIRALWAALIETYCLPWSLNEYKRLGEQEIAEEDDTLVLSAQIERSEVLTLLREAGLSELAGEMSEQARLSIERYHDEEEDADPETQPLSNAQIDEAVHSSSQENPFEIEPDETVEAETYTQPIANGISIGSATNTLQLRGWLASISVRALAFFEYLVCGRRCMPFGYEPSEPYGIFIGYLTPDEVWSLGTFMRGVQDPTHKEAEADYLRFRAQHSNDPASYSLIDEVTPFYASAFHRVIDMAAAQGLGLICSID